MTHRKIRYARRWAVRVALVLGLTLAAATAAAPAASEPQAAAGRLDFQVRWSLISGPYTLPCPGSEAQAAIACVPLNGTGFVRGLGSVSVTYSWRVAEGPPACPADFVKPLESSGFLSVARKGALTFTVAEGARCMPFADLRNEPQEFTITGGTFPFEWVSGRGTIEQRSSGPGPSATETWAGTLEAPGHAFDVTAPRLRATGSQSVRARRGEKSARVTFKVTASDGVDGALPVSCRPGSGSRFKIGRTTVRCQATDSSGNTAKTAFTVTVKRRR